ncbi:3D domain-containing protein [Brevibacillus daliensis]|uniref:3D domain-containing protein n=1 Tax=Brevibacillus daliensis TaxID=2892995 RepID=UPI001E645938|nr:3D domain-containing protein [Brevibacillus daliensis]
MKWLRFVGVLTLSCLILLGETTVGYSYNFEDSGTTTHSVGLQQKKEGYKMIKKRHVLSSSMMTMKSSEPKVKAAVENEKINDVGSTNQPSLEAFAQYPKVRVVATGYYAGVESTGKGPGHPSYGITYSGVKVHRGTYSTIAADLKVFPLGTILYVPGYGYGVVTDKGGAIKGNKLDLYFKTKKDVYSQWGKKEVEVFVVHRGKGYVNERMMKTLNEDGVAAFAQIRK